MQQDAGQQVGERALQRETQDGGEHGRGGHHRGDIDAALPEHAEEHHHKGQNQDEIAQQERKMHVGTCRKDLEHGHD